MRMKSLLIVALILMPLMGVQAQQKSDGKHNGEAAAASAGAAVSETASPVEIARIAIARQGGDKFRNLKSLSLFGSARLYYGSRPAESTTGQFAIVQAGDRARTDIETPDVSYREIHDGKRAYSTLNPASVPPHLKFGLAVLAHVDQPGYTVTGLPDKKALRGFRLTDAEGNATDFYIDPATGRIMEFSFTYNNIKFFTEYKSFKEVDGVLVPTSFLRKYGLPRVDIYIELKVKEAKVNQPIGDDVFIIPEH
jgi:hypothetical protein